MSPRRACRNRHFPLAVAAMAIGAVISAGSCHRRPHVDGTVAIDSVTHKWTEAGFDTGQLKDIEPTAWGAVSCVQGEVASLDVLICEYPDGSAMAQGEDKVRARWHPDAIFTGVVTNSRQTSLAISARPNVDKNGRTIAQLVKAFRETQ